MAGMIKAYRRPKTAEDLVKAVELWLCDAFGLSGCSGRDEWGGSVEVESRRFNARVIVEDVDRTDGGGWAKLDDLAMQHLEEWKAAGRPSLEAIRLNGALGPLTQVEAAAVRTLRAGECMAAIGVPAEEVAEARRRIFHDILNRGVDANLGEPEPPPAPKPKRRRKGAGRA